MTPTDTETTCDWCGKTFIPTPDCFTESGFSADPEDMAGEEWKGDEHQCLPDPTDAQKVQMMKEMDLTSAQLEELIKTGNVMTGFSCICQECQDECESENQP